MSCPTILPSFNLITSHQQHPTPFIPCYWWPDQLYSAPTHASLLVSTVSRLPLSSRWQLARPSCLRRVPSHAWPSLASPPNPPSTRTFVVHGPPRCRAAFSHCSFHSSRPLLCLLPAIPLPLSAIGPMHSTRLNCSLAAQPAALVRLRVEVACWTCTERSVDCCPKC